MPKSDLELGPDDYRVEKRGRWVHRDDFRAIFLIGVPALLLWAGYAWWHRSEIATVLLVTSVALPALGVGIFLGAWLKRFD